MKQIYTLSLATLMLLSSCGTSRHTAQTKHTVTAVRTTDGKKEFRLTGMRGWFGNLSDTLKKGNTITINWLKRG